METNPIITRPKIGQLFLPDLKSPQPEGADKIIFMVDDSVSLRMLIRRIVQKGHPEWKVLEAGNGVEALAHREEMASADLFIIDLEMPKMDGLGLVKRLVLDPELRDKPFIIFSGICPGDMQDAVGNKKNVEYLEKPCHTAKVLEKIHALR